MRRTRWTCWDSFKQGEGRLLCLSALARFASNQSRTVVLTKPLVDAECITRQTFSRVMAKTTETSSPSAAAGASPLEYVSACQLGTRLER
jgi:hypothetical protein